MSEKLLSPTLVQTKEEEQLININILRELVGDDHEVIIDILHEFLVNAAAIATELEAAYEAAQYDQTPIAAHKLKSSARYIGALRLGEICEQIEYCGEKGENEKLNELLSSFKKEMAAVENYLVKWLNINLTNYL